MTLREWCDEAGVMPTHPTTERGVVGLCCDQLEPTRSELWHLGGLAMRGNLAIVGLGVSVALLGALPLVFWPLGVWVALLSVVAIVDELRSEW